MTFLNTAKATRASGKLREQYTKFYNDGGALPAYPNIENIAGILTGIRVAMFPGFFRGPYRPNVPSSGSDSLIQDIYRELSKEMLKVIPEREGSDYATWLAYDIAEELIDQLSTIQSALFKDAQAGFDGDPAAENISEVVLSYPGFFAVFVYRIAHFLYEKRVPLIPRIMSEHAHSVTGIDIHPGAKIGASFFIDHGTGVVIGETAVIGDNVKLYQGVTLGALSTKSGQKLAGMKRHPTIEDGVTIYSGATILGGETVIGKNSTIGGNVFITNSVPENSTVNLDKGLGPEWTEIKIENEKNSNDKQDQQV